MNTESLMANADFVRNLARSLVYDEHHADDVTQEAWIVAMHNKPSKEKATRSWLYSVVRNISYKLLRSEGRRTLYEQAAPRPCETPSPEQILERKRIRVLLMKSVISLRDPYRSVIMLRFYENLPPREISRHLDIPVESVKTQIKRGLNMLRDNLDGHYNGSREKWSMILLPVAGIGTNGSSAFSDAIGAPVSTDAGWGLKLCVSSLCVIGAAVVLYMTLYSGMSDEPLMNDSGSALLPQEVVGTDQTRVVDNIPTLPSGDSSGKERTSEPVSDNSFMGSDLSDSKTRRHVNSVNDGFPLSPAEEESQRTIYNSFGSERDGWNYNHEFGWTVAGDDVPGQYGVEQALAFDASISGVVSDIWMAVWCVPNAPGADEVRVRLTSNEDGRPPGPDDVIEEWILTDFETWADWSTPHHLKGKGTSRIEEGKSYWLWLVGSETTRCGFSMNEDHTITCPHTLRREGEDWLPVSDETTCAFRIDLFDGYGLSVDTTSISRQEGGELGFSLHAGKEHAFRTYHLLGTLSGITRENLLPGGSIRFPLQLDTFSLIIQSLENSFDGFAGRLDAEGRGTANMRIPSCALDAVEGEMHFAYYLDRPYDFASNPIAIEIIP